MNVNAVAFGLILTRMTSTDANAGETVNIDGLEIRVGLNPEMLKTHAQRNPLGRGGTPASASLHGPLCCLLACFFRAIFEIDPRMPDHQEPMR